MEDGRGEGSQANSTGKKRSLCGELNLDFGQARPGEAVLTPHIKSQVMTRTSVSRYRMTILVLLESTFLNEQNVDL